MAMLIASIGGPITYEDLDDFPNDGKRREVIGGVLYVSPAPARPHQKVLGRFFALFRGEIELTGLGEVYFSPVDVRFANGDQVQPDLVVLLNHRLDTYRGSTVHGPPDILVEVIRPDGKGESVRVTGHSRVLGRRSDSPHDPALVAPEWPIRGCSSGGGRPVQFDRRPNARR